MSYTFMTPDGGYKFYPTSRKVWFGAYPEQGTNSYTYDCPPFEIIFDCVFTDRWEPMHPDLDMNFAGMTAMDFLRFLRNRKLKQSDIYTVPDFPLSDDKKTKLAAYRQALRDLPQTSTPSFEHGVLIGVSWPVFPFA